MYILILIIIIIIIHIIFWYDRFSNLRLLASFPRLNITQKYIYIL